jgi:predicted HTH transcriptional regulator
MTLDELADEIRAGKLQEHLHASLELKEDWAQKYGEKLSSLANKPNQSLGWLVVGISDDGKLAGKSAKWAKRTEEIISQHINANLDPIQACTGIECREIDGSWIIAIGIRNPGEVVYWANHAFSASGTTIKEMAPDEILKLRIQLPGLTDFSSQSVESEYNPELTKLFAERVADRGHPSEFSQGDRSDAATVLKKLGMHSKQVARILFGSCSYRIVKYGRDGEPIENRKHTGLFGLLTDQFIGEVQQWTAGQLQTEIAPYPQRALKEAFANAVAHAAYFENDGDIIVELLPEGISIGNLCVRESAYFANRWFSRSHKSINGLLMEVLRIAGLVDELGRGKNLIFAESIKGGKQPPEVVLERAGKYDRWKLLLYGGTQDENLLRLLERSRAVYKDEQKALIAHALVLWRNQPVSEIRNYIDGDFSRQFAEVLSGLEGPMFYYREKDMIMLTRWAEILLGEGKDSKVLSPGEEEHLRSLSYDLLTKYHEGYIAPKELRKLAGMGETKSERVLSSNILAKWCNEGVVKRIRHGQYQFIKKALPPIQDFQELLKLFNKPE